MVVSDAGLASTEPQWWNASPLGCFLLGMQPRGGWQVMQRAVQCGSDTWAHCFGVTCKGPVVYAYFACTIRNRLEVWDSRRFFSPMEELETNCTPKRQKQCLCVDDKCSHAVHVNDTELTSDARDDGLKIDGKPEGAAPPLPELNSALQPIKSATESARSRRESMKEKQGKHHADTNWNSVDRGVAGLFSVQRPTKLIDGSRGGQAFMCNTLVPMPGQAYGVVEQSLLQLLSVILVVAGLAKDQSYNGFLELLQEDFEIGSRLGIVFKNLFVGVVLCNFLILGLIVVVFYAVWDRNVLHASAPYAIQLCSLLAWASGAVGLMMMGGNPRVRIEQSKAAPKHIQERLDILPEGIVPLEFGSLHGSVFVGDRGSCGVPSDLIKAVCRWRLRVIREKAWFIGIAWFSTFLLISIALQIAGSTVATIGSEVMSVIILLSTSILRGAGISGHESWMIPRWKRRQHARYAIKLQGQIRSRVSISETSGG